MAAGDDDGQLQRVDGEWLSEKVDAAAAGLLCSPTSPRRLLPLLPPQYSGGVPYEALDALGAHDSPQESYYSFLRRLEPDLGVKLQVGGPGWGRAGVASQSIVRRWASG